MSRYQTAAPEGQPTHVPTVRIRGVETGSDRYYALLGKYQGALTQFHLGQQQQANLSGQRYYRASRAMPGAHMIYQNNEGQETITLELTTSGGGEEEKVESEEYWKWAIVEVTIPNIMGLTSSVASAWMTPPPKNKEGYAINKTHPIDTDRPPLSYPIDELGTFIGDVQDNTYHASLRVDLRPFPGGVKFDLYGYIRRYQDGTKLGDPTNPQRTMWRGAFNVSAGGAGYTTLGGSSVPGTWYAVGDISGRTQTNYLYKSAGTPHTTLADIAASFPALPGPFTTTSSIPPPQGSSLGDSGPTYAGTGFIWTPGSGNCPDPATMNISSLISAAGGLFTDTVTLQPDGVSFIKRGIGARTSAGIPNQFGTETDLSGGGPVDAYGNWGISFYDYTIYYVSDHPTVPNYVFPVRDCPVNFIVLDDSPDAMTNRFGSPLKDNIYRWEASKKYPARWPMKQIGTIHMVGVDDSGFAFPTKDNHYSMIKLGTVIIHPKKGKGGIKFIAA